MQMYSEVEYEMTQADLDAMLAACKPTPVMFLSGGQSMFDSPQENANRAWKELGSRMGFDHMTVRPIAGKNARFFTAVPNETEAAKQKRIARKTEAKRLADIAAHQKAIDEHTEALAKLGNPQ